MLGLRNVFFNQICLNRMPVSKNNIRNRIRLSCFLDANSKNYSLSNNKLHFSFLTVENVRHFSFFDHKYYRFIKGKINNLNFLNRKKDVELGMFLYQSLEHVHFKEFYTHLKMSDTYRSWFMVSELHVWMLLVRLQQEGVDGRFIRDAVVEAFYQDSEQRSKILAPLDGSRRKGQLADLYEDFKSALLFYDEGLVTEDRVLANALWFHFFAKDCDDPRVIEILIRYIRHQINFLCHLNSQDIKNYNRSHIIWQPLEPHAKIVNSLQDSLL